jgi:TonB family protein
MTFFWPKDSFYVYLLGSLCLHLLLVLLFLEFKKPDILLTLKTTELTLTSASIESLKKMEQVQQIEKTKVLPTESATGKKESVKSSSSKSASRAASRSLLDADEDWKPQTVSKNAGQTISPLSPSLKDNGSLVASKTKADERPKNLGGAGSGKNNYEGKELLKSADADIKGISGASGQGFKSKDGKNETGTKPAGSGESGTSSFLGAELGRRLSYMPLFELPEELIGRGIRSEMIVSIDVDPEGRVIGPKIEKSSGISALDRAVLSDVSRYLFEAIAGSQNSHGTIRYQFNY